MPLQFHQVSPLLAVAAAGSCRKTPSREEIIWQNFKCDSFGSMLQCDDFAIFSGVTSGGSSSQNQPVALLRACTFHLPLLQSCWHPEFAVHYAQSLPW
jgi:hypothetical protein